jgi:hypothetical protein
MSALSMPSIFLSKHQQCVFFCMVLSNQLTIDSRSASCDSQGLAVKNTVDEAIDRCLVVFNLIRGGYNTD